MNENNQGSSTPESTDRSVEKKTYTVYETVYAFLTVLLGYLFIKLFLPSDSHLGKAIASVLMLAPSVVLMLLERVRLNAVAAASLAFSALFAVSFVLCDSDWLVLISEVGFIGTYIYFIYKTFDNSVEKYPSSLFFFDMFKAAVTQPISSMGDVFSAIFARLDSKRCRKTVLYFMIGIGISIIPCFIVILLLCYDNAFDNAMGKVFSSDILLEAVRFGFGLIVAMYLFGIWYSSKHKKNPQYNKERCEKSRIGMRFLPPAVALGVCLPFVFVYAVFMFSQLGYYFSAFGGDLPTGYSYAEYARSGFFQLCTVTVINSIIVACIDIFVSSGENKRRVSARVSTLLIGVSNLLLVITAISKMIMYVNTYGLTLKRVYTSYFMICIALVFIVVIIGAVVRKFNVATVSLAIILVMATVLPLSNTPAIVSHYNTERALSDPNISLDMAYFTEIGASAVPDAVILASGAADPYTREEARKFAEYYKENCRYNGFMSFTLPAYSAEKAANDALGTPAS